MPDTLGVSPRLSEPWVVLHHSVFPFWEGAPGGRLIRPARAPCQLTPSPRPPGRLLPPSRPLHRGQQRPAAPHSHLRPQQRRPRLPSRHTSPATPRATYQAPTWPYLSTTPSTHAPNASVRAPRLSLSSHHLQRGGPAAPARASARWDVGCLPRHHARPRSSTRSTDVPLRVHGTAAAVHGPSRMPGTRCIGLTGKYACPFEPAHAPGPL